MSIIGGCCGTTPEHIALLVDELASVEPARREPALRARLRVDLQPRRLRPGAVVPRRRRAHERQRLEEVPRGDARRRLGHHRRHGRRAGPARAATSSTCASTTSAATAPSTWPRSPAGSPPQSTAPLMVDSTEPDVVETALQCVGGKAILNSVNLEDGDDPGTRLDRFLSLAKRLRRRRRRHVHRRRRARPARARVEGRRRPGDPRHRRRPLRPGAARPLLRPARAHARHRHRGEPAATASRRSRASGASRRSCPGVNTILGLSNISFGLNPAARQALNSVFLHECQEAGLDAAIVHAARIVPINRLPEEQVETCLDLDLRPPPRRLRPAAPT